ncbi:MAG: uroporphyrinogen decarboxylase [Deltaproteobacteria bacterium]|nr:uroporphyrinogen decarboxylase [Deltaproteobacteria bacterium]
MLTKRQNLLETIRGGKPDRFVNQYEALTCQDTMFGMIMSDPVSAGSPVIAPGTQIVNGWGVTIQWPEGLPGPFPVHDAEHKVIKDITKWREVVKSPRLDYPESEWAKYKPAVEAIDREEVFATVFVSPGVFDQTHYLMGVDTALMNLVMEPEAMKELINYITEWELGYAKLLCEHFKPDAVFHHDDWGTHISSFMSPDMFNEFFVDSYKKIYGYYKANGVELVVHHNDSYSANLVPYMIEMGIDIWQGCVTTNNTPELVKKYGGKISFMGDIDNGVVDRENWTREIIAREVRRACETNGKLYFIPNTTMGGPMSTYPGVYEAVSEEIDKMSEEMF